MDYFEFLVSIIAAVISVVAILRANEANRLAEKANQIAKHYNLRPIRLSAYNVFRGFAHYCTTYRTLFLQKMVTGTSELMNRRDSFRNELDELGPLGMPDVESKAKEFTNMAAELQRALDRSSEET